MSVSGELSRAVRARDGGRCQYCLMAESLQGANFHVEHIIPQGKGGRSNLENLVLACLGCNLHKASRITAIDPVTGRSMRLFHPVLQLWSEHFRFNRYQIEGLTAEGRACGRKPVATERKRSSSRDRGFFSLEQRDGTNDSSPWPVDRNSARLCCAMPAERGERARVLSVVL